MSPGTVQTRQIFPGKNQHSDRSTLNIASKPLPTRAVKLASLWLAAVPVILALALGAAAFYRIQFQHLSQHVKAQLTAIETLKINQIAAWRKERLSNAGALMDSPFLTDAIARWSSAPQPALTEKLLNRFHALQQNYGYYDVLLVNPDGRIRLSLKGNPGALDQDGRDALATALGKRQPALTDIHTEPQLPFPHLSLAAPLFHTGPAHTPIGALLLIIDARQELFPLLQVWPTPSGTAETLLIRRDGDKVQYLNELRLPPTRKDALAEGVVLGRTGFGEGVDYRGAEVIAVSQPVPGTAWFLVAKMDQAEAFAELRHHLELVLALGAAGIGLLLMLGLTVWQTKRMGAVLQVNEERLRTAQQAANLGLWDWNIVTGQIFWSEEFYALCKLPTSISPSLDAFATIVHQDDFPSYSTKIQESIDQKTALENECRIVCGDGAVRWIRAIGNTYFDQAGQPQRMLGYCLDISERKRIESALRESEERLALATRSNGVGVWDWNLQTLEMVWDDSMYMLYHIRSEDFSGAVDAWEKSLHPDDRERGEQEVRAALSGEKPFDTEFRVCWPDGEVRHIKAVAKVFRDGEGKPTRMLGTNIDITDHKRTEAALREREQMLSESQQIAHIGSWSYHFADPIVWSAETYRLYGVAPDTFTPTVEALIGLIHPDDRAALRAQIETLADGGNPGELVFRLPLPDGGVRYLSGRGQRVRDAGGKAVRVAGTVQDVTERKLADESLRESEDRLRLAIEGAGLGTWHWNLGTDELVFSPNCRAMFGLPPDTPVTYEKFLSVLNPDDREATEQAVRRSLREKSDYRVEYRAIWPDGSEHWIASLGHGFYGGDGKPLRMVGVTLDISERKKSEEVIWQQANFDVLTGLPNRRMVSERLKQEINKSSRKGKPLALMFIDLDRFKEINDSLGHEMGDLLLKQVARRMLGCVRETDIVGRLGGDEFTVILGELDDLGSVERVAHSILTKVAEPYQLDADLAHASVSIGVTLYPHDAADIATLLTCADQAMYAAKHGGRNRLHFYTPAMQEAAKLHLRLVNDLRTAVKEGQFRLYFQPIVGLETGSVHKAEALVRWQHPALGLLGPLEFIPIAEETGLIVELADWVFRQAAKEASRLRASLNPDFQISINKSLAQFRGKSGESAAWLAYLKELGLPGRSIVLEITENALTGTIEAIDSQLQSCRDGGMEVSLDGFGTGYSSLSLLLKFDLDYLKIDKSLIQKLAPDSKDLAFCAAIVVMARKLGIKVIAEGIETQGQCELLKQSGCEYGQGYLFAKPLPVDEFEQLIMGEEKP